MPAFVVKDAYDHGTWIVTGTGATKRVRPGTHGLGHIEILPDETFPAAFERVMGPSQVPRTFTELLVPPGTFHPRIARPVNEWPAPGVYGITTPQNYIREFADICGQLSSLFGRLETICQVVQPDASNLCVYGHEIRNLLILACTEVEAQFRAVLQSNGYPADRPSTRDFVRLKAPMRLDEYRISFSRYPWLQPLSPFRSWTDVRPTRSLGWYDAYNAVKHDRESSFARATLSHVFEAVGACYIVLLAQGGDQALNSWGGLPFFRVLDVPRFPLEEWYDASGMEPETEWVKSPLAL